MSDPEIATKAPEGDGAEQTVAAPSSAAKASPAPAPGVCDDCMTDRPTPAGKASIGEMAQLGGVEAYISKPSEYPHAPAKLLLLLTGGTGHKSTNNQIQADKFAGEGYLVVMPDLFEGDSAPNSSSANFSPTEQPIGSGSLIETFKTKAAETAKSFLIDMWLARHTQEKVLPLLRMVLDQVKDEFADAVAYGGGIYAVGYCFGGRYVLLLAAERQVAQYGSGGLLSSPWSYRPAEAADEKADELKTMGPYIKAGAVVHATLVSTEDFEGLKSPLSVVCVENDPLFPDDVRTAGENYMNKHHVEHEVQVYPGVPHGFAVIGEYEDANIREAQSTAYDQILKWLKAH